ncbi:terpene cyclase/mutase family protein [Maioricimonas sp. JC845]|uniref:terpene cyclase/mutase family protein n=1 Tax=Maioricimonas sp. JC845 TaxID=3232138 RepID=UPI0034582828
MSSGRIRFEDRLGGAAVQDGKGPHFSLTSTTRGNVNATDVRSAVARTRDWLLEQQNEDGYWVAELEGDTILESEYILLLAYLGQGQSDVARQAAAYILENQLPDGSWTHYPGGPIEISGAVKAYWALKITGHDPDAEYMVRAREAILAAGGAEKVNSFTRYYMALLGQISYQQCPAVPPEIMLLPSWMPFNIYEMSSWSRTILVPLSILWAYQPKVDLPPEHRIDELFVNGPEKLPVTMPPSEQLDDLKQQTRINWGAIFRGIDRVWKVVERCRIKPLRSVAVARAARWMRERFAHSDGLGAIFPPIIWSVVALKCLGHRDDSPEVVAALQELERLMIREDKTIRLQPCKSPVWDTAISTLALREAGVSERHPAIRRSVQWLLSKEVRQPGDWSVRRPGLPPGGWYFEFNNAYYPDIDDTIMVTMALTRCLPGRRHADWSASLVPTGPRSYTDEADLAAIVSGQTDDPLQSCVAVEAMRPMLAAIRRGVRWTFAMQSRNGGWAAFDADNDREILTRVPFADHNAMIDPATADITARVLEMFSCVGLDTDHDIIARALRFVWDQQEPDGAWYGRWGVNYIYGTWQVLVGLTGLGVPAEDPRLQKGADWLEACQQSDGGWGETPRTYDEPELRGQGPTTASQTAWALMGLMAAGRVDSDAVKRGIQYLLDTQKEDGTWDEPWFTGTGFPRVFYLRYHLYRIYFPLMALGRYERLTGQRVDG